MAIVNNSPVHEEFSRPEIFKIRKKPLHSYLASMGYEFDFATTPVSEMHQFVLSKGIDVSPLTGQRQNLGEPSEAEQRISSHLMSENQTVKSENEALRRELEAYRLQATKTSTVADEESVYENDDYTSWSMPALRKECKNKGIAMSPKDKKADLVGKLNGKQNAA